MKIFLHTFFDEDSKLAEIIKNNEILSRHMAFRAIKGRGPVENDIDTESEAFAVFVELAKSDLIIRLYPYIVYSDEEISEFKYFALRSNNIIRLNKKDSKLNELYIDSIPYLCPTSGSHIKLIDKIFLSDFSPAIGTLYCFNEFQEFIFSKEVHDVFSEASLSGFNIRRVINSVNNIAYEELFSLFTDCILPPIHEDISVYDKRLTTTEMLSSDTIRNICILGSQVYDSSGKVFADFNRTAEGFYDGWCPEWIVSSRVKKVYEDNNLSGLSFVPVYETVTKQYINYLSKWKSIIDKVQRNQNMKLVK